MLSRIKFLLKLFISLLFGAQINLVFITSCHAQSNVDLSGQVDSAIRYSTNTSPTGESKVSLGAAPDGFGILRLTGNEDLVDDMSAHFKLESQFFTNNGTQVANPANSVYGLFGRESSVGLSIGAHTVDAGRLQGKGTAAEPLVLADPTGARGYYTETIWPGIFSGLRFDNAIRYRFVADGFTAGLMHVLGGQPGSNAELSMSSATFGYSAGAFKSIMAYQEVSDSKDNHGKTYTLGGLYNLNTWTLSASYMNSKEDKGFAGIPSTGVISPLPPLLSAQTFNFYYGGLACRATEAITFKTAYYVGLSDGGTFLPSTENGKIQTWYGVAEYALSKRTKLVASADYNNWTGGYAGYWGSSAEQQTGVKFSNGKNTRTNISLGIEHLF